MGEANRYFFWKAPVDGLPEFISGGHGVSVVPGLGDWVLLIATSREIPPDAIPAGEVVSFLEGRGRAMPDWQPISTAPKDGTDVLIFAGETGEQFVAFWATSIEDGDSQWVFARSPGQAFIVRDPTHWMPLPPPPAEGGQNDR